MTIDILGNILHSTYTHHSRDPVDELTRKRLRVQVVSDVVWHMKVGTTYSIIIRDNGTNALSPYGGYDYVVTVTASAILDEPLT